MDVIEHAIKTGEKIAVGVIDIDCFKQHNDKYGHIQGDRCLQHVADVLKNAVEKRGKAYRFGGDEFVLLIQNGEENTIPSVFFYFIQCFIRMFNQTISAFLSAWQETCISL